MADPDALMAGLEEAVANLTAATDDAPFNLDAFWVDCVRISLTAWVRELHRDLRRCGRALADASANSSAPEDEQIAALEEALWRLAAATEKVDAIVAIVFGANAIELYDAQARSIRFRPSFDENGLRLREIGSGEALRLRETRAKLEGGRASLRRNQLVHSLAPLVDLHDLVCYTLVHHRDGRIIPGGYELGRLGPERWNEGVTELKPEVLFARRLQEAQRALDVLIETVAALSDAVRSNGLIHVPQFVYRDAGTELLALERPQPKGPVPRVEVEFVLGRDDDAERRVVSCSYRMAPGIEIRFDEGLWRVIAVEAGDGDRIDQRAVCLRQS